LRTLALATLVALGAAGCTVSPGRSPSGSAPAPRGPAAEPNAASVALLERSQAARSAGRYGEAAASLERALRIDPNNALLWIELAEIKAADGDRAQAGEMARKALTLAAGDRAIEARARRLL